MDNVLLKFETVFLLLLSSLALSQEEKQADKLVFADLGHGYRVAHVSVDLSQCKTCFENIAQCNDLYYKERRLGRVGVFDISPSGRYAVWEDYSPEARKFGGRILLYDENSQTIRDIAPRPFALPKDFYWNEAGRTLRITFYGKGTKTFTRIVELTTMAKSDSK